MDRTRKTRQQAVLCLSLVLAASGAFGLYRLLMHQSASGRPVVGAIKGYPNELFRDIDLLATADASLHGALSDFASPQPASHQFGAVEHLPIATTESDTDSLPANDDKVATVSRAIRTQVRLPVSSPTKNNTRSVLTSKKASLPPRFARLPQPTRRPANDPAFQAVTARAKKMVDHARSLAERGAIHSAQADLIQAIQVVATALDARESTRQHSIALAEGIRALQEAKDFIANGGLEADIDVATIVSTHRTPVLKQTDLTGIVPLVALQRYYTFSQWRLIHAAGRQSVASQAYYTLGRVQTVLAEVDGRMSHGGPKAMAFHQAALLVDQGNYRAANELGVLLARYGQYDQARRVLLHSLTISSQPQTWQNLSTVHQHLGQQDLAMRAHHEGRLAAQYLRSGPKQPNNNGEESPEAVRWLEPEKFAEQTTPDSGELAQPHPPTTASRPTNKTKNAAHLADPQPIPSNLQEKQAERPWYHWMTKKR